MPQVKEKFLKIADRRSTKAVIAALKKSLKRYSSKYGSLYVGIAVDPRKRFAQHNKAVTSGTGNKQSDEPWPLCFVIFETGSDHRVKKIEKELVTWALKDQKISKKMLNDRAGGAGRRPKDGSKAYVYVLADPKETKWTIV